MIRLFSLFLQLKEFVCVAEGGEPEENPCFTGRHGCDTNAICRPEQGNQFSCQCAAGFSGDGRVCYGAALALAHTEGQILLFPPKLAPLNICSKCSSN